MNSNGSSQEMPVEAEVIRYKIAGEQDSHMVSESHCTDDRLIQMVVGAFLWRDLAFLL